MSYEESETTVRLRMMRISHQLRDYARENVLEQLRGRFLILCLRETFFSLTTCKFDFRNTDDI